MTSNLPQAVTQVTWQWQCWWLDGGNVECWWLDSGGNVAKLGTWQRRRDSETVAILQLLSLLAPFSHSDRYCVPKKPLQTLLCEQPVAHVHVALTDNVALTMLHWQSCTDPAAIDSRHFTRVVEIARTLSCGNCQNSQSTESTELWQLPEPWARSAGIFQLTRFNLVCGTLQVTTHFFFCFEGFPYNFGRYVGPPGLIGLFWKLHGVGTFAMLHGNWPKFHGQWSELIIINKSKSIFIRFESTESVTFKRRREVLKFLTRRGRVLNKQHLRFPRIFSRDLPGLHMCEGFHHRPQRMSTWVQWLF